jgi:N-acetylmuramoyl-L-alanine amidase
MYTVNQGDCLSSIADDFGLPDWSTIYNHPQNASFRTLRPDPNVIFPGDQLFVPDPRPRNESGATDQRHVFRLNVKTVKLRLVLLDEDLQPMPDTAYTLTFDGNQIDGRTDGSGLLEHQIPARLSSAQIASKFTRDGEETGYTWDLKVGQLDPPTELSGVQARLNNLGYNTGPVDGVQGPRTTDAIQQFQEKFGLKVDGIVGPITRNKLVEVHGC